jgi:hypothetical protein
MMYYYPFIDYIFCLLLPCGKRQVKLILLLALLLGVTFLRDATTAILGTTFTVLPPGNPLLFSYLHT